jgi:hypothetical protein
MVQDHVVNAWDHLEGQRNAASMGQERGMQLKAWGSWVLSLSQYQNTTLQAPLEQCMSFHIGINSKSILQS